MKFTFSEFGSEATENLIAFTIAWKGNTDFHIGSNIMTKENVIFISSIAILVPMF